MGCGKIFFPYVKGSAAPANPRPCMLFRLEALAFRLADGLCTVAGNGNPLCAALMVVVVDAVYGVTVHHELRLRCFEQVLEHAAAVLLKASAAGIAAVFRRLAFHIDPALAAAVFRVVDACLYRTFQSCHFAFLLLLSLQKVVCSVFPF